MLPAIASLRIGIVDAGAIATLALAVCLAVAGYTVSVLARGDSLAVIKRKDVCLIDQQEQHTVKHVPVV